MALVLNTDSAPQCLLVGKLLGASRKCISAPCRAHQGCHCMTRVISLGGVMSAIFCASLLLKRHRIKRLMRKALTEFVHDVDGGLKVDVDPPTEADSRHGTAVWDMVQGMVGNSSQDNSSVFDQQKRTARLAALHKLRRWIPAIRVGERLTHYCPWGCHETYGQARQEVGDAFQTLFLDHPPKVPAWNKWGKIIPPLQWFTTFCAVGGALSRMIASSVRARERDVEHAEEEEVVGLDTEAGGLRQDMESDLSQYGGRAECAYRSSWTRSASR